MILLDRPPNETRVATILERLAMTRTQQLLSTELG